MNFGFTDEQELLRAEVRRFLDQNASLDEVRKWVQTPEGFERSLWNRMAELGWVGLTFSEVHGGVGLGWVDLVVVLEETGRTLFPSPLIATVLAGTAIEALGTEEQQARWLPGIVDGSRIGTVALTERSDRLDAVGIELTGERDGDGVRLDGEKWFVLDAGAADLFVVAFRSGPDPEDLGLAVVPRDAAGLEVTTLRSIDETQRQGRVLFSGVQVSADHLLGEAGTAWPVIERLYDCGAAAVTAEMIGAGEGALALTTAYAKQRIQFGEPIGRFQGVKHPLAEMYVDIESYKSLLYYAAWAIDESADEIPLAVSRAKAYASEALPRIGIDVIQLHGGIGYTWEYDAHLYLKRAKWARPAFGSADLHSERIATLGGL